MTRAKYPARREAERNYQHKVDVPVPRGGFGVSNALGAMTTVEVSKETFLAFAYLIKGLPGGSPCAQPDFPGGKPSHQQGCYSADRNGKAPPNRMMGRAWAE